MTDEPKEESKPSMVGTGLALGMCFGVALGSAFDNVGTGLALGLSFGIVFGACMDARAKSRAD